MFSQPDHYHNLSLRLSAVLSDIGVNQKNVMHRRRIWMLIETLVNIHTHRDGAAISTSHFGSQTEGSTTLGLKSDVDRLCCNHDIRLIQDWSDWEPGKEQYLMIQDDTTSPGYCLLQAVKSDAPLPAQARTEHCSIDERDRVLLRHSKCLTHIKETDTRHGPAGSIHRGPGQYDTDHVFAIYCSSWPRQADSWLQKQNVSGWPTDDMKRYSAEQGCFAVPVGSTGIYNELEWRISTSFAERCLMFSLNMTQIRCYILMKMIIKTFLKPKCGEAVSSFMCKTILFHCIADSEVISSWNECTLLTWLNKCLQVLLNSIITEHCPHFIIPENNLLAGKLFAEMKHQLTDVMCTLTGNLEQSLLRISIDDLGNRLHVKSGSRPICGINLMSAYDIALLKTWKNIHFLVFIQRHSIRDDLKEITNNNSSFSSIQKLIQRVIFLNQLYLAGSKLEQAAVSLSTPFYCASIGSIIASADIQNSHCVSPEALRWFSLSLNSDVSSSTLKLASSLYCAGELERCEIILAELHRRVTQSTVLTQCCCYCFTQRLSRDFVSICYEKYEHSLKHNMALCVMHLPHEINCVPNELKYEMVRSTGEDWQYRDENDCRMDWAFVDSIPYLYFLQYKVYSQLHRPGDKMRAFVNLAWTIDNEPNLGHRETALNLLGQCMEQENRYEDAFKFYAMSLNVRERNNAAKWHISRLLARVFRK